MKNFSLEEYLKNPERKIVTRDGHKARVICTDRNVDDYIVIALVEEDLVEEDLGEYIYSYTKEGLLRCNTESPSDLFFAPERKTGWINVSRMAQGNAGEITYTGAVYPTKEEAIAGYSGVGLLATIQIEWEE